MSPGEQNVPPTKKSARKILADLMTRLRSLVFSTLALLWRIVGSTRTWVLISVGLVGFYIMQVVRPFDPPIATDLTPEQIASGWNESIGRLGIIANYPPQEDLRVGDVWAVVHVDTPTPLLGKSARVAHLNLRPDIVEFDSTRPVFSNTVASKILKPDAQPSAPKPPQPNEGTTSSPDVIGLPDRVETTPSEESKKLLSTTIAAFPTVKIYHTDKSRARAGWSFLELGGGRNNHQVDEFVIKEVETYGAPLLPAYERLLEWCAAPGTKPFCTDDSAMRYLLSIAVSPNVMQQLGGEYTSRIQLRLITRVFMTREIQTRRWTVDSRGASVQVGESKDGVSATPAKKDSTESRQADLIPPPSPRDLDQSGTASTQLSQGTTISVNGKFQRPLVFGYRAIVIELDRAKPPKTDGEAKREAK